MIDACTNIKDIRDTLDFVLNPATGEEEADLCKALTDIKKHAERQGDLLRSIADPLFQKKLFREYKI